MCRRRCKHRQMDNVLLLLFPCSRVQYCFFLVLEHERVTLTSMESILLQYSLISASCLGLRPLSDVSGAAALGWPRHKDGRRTHAQSGLLQRPPRMKARPWCSKKALQRSAEETACTGGNQPSVTAAGGLRPRQLYWRSLVRKASCKFEAERQKAAKEERRRQKEHHPHLKPSFVQRVVGGAHQESVFTATSEHARIDHQSSQQFLVCAE